MQNLSEQQLQQMMVLEEMKHYNKMVSTCFKECILTMTSKTLAPQEKTCMENCFRKTSKFNEKLVQSLNFVTIARSNQQQIQQ
ncbi:unnamed protein product [Blepharisma stoltei]|uniref:Mitochondrial import inner membrane translocase subunit n=1 Tax=Blepharisma stoltei TaxID=1481888 RepID=A0AAU9IMT3_9CILI|nr:unnamed protein product [Blepharisma stoltei]